MSPPFSDSSAAAVRTASGTSSSTSGSVVGVITAVKRTGCSTRANSSAPPRKPNTTFLIARVRSYSMLRRVTAKSPSGSSSISIRSSNP